MENNCLISVIVPVHNTANYLHRCINSIREQTLKEIEIILVDNLSTDGSSEICDEYARLDARIKVLHLAIANASVARNAGIECATAPYIGFIDSDDYISPNMYKELLDAINFFKVDLAYSNFLIEHSDGQQEFFDSNKGEIRKVPSRDVVREMMCDTLNSSCCTKLFKKTLFSSLKFPTHNVFEDRFILHQWILACDQVVWVDKAFYHYVERETSICHSISPKQRYQFFLAQLYRLDFINNSTVFDNDELYRMRTYLVKSCLGTLKEVCLSPDNEEVRCLIVDMRNHLKKLLSFSKEEIDSRYYIRLRKIAYFWSIYYWMHFKFKKNSL